MKSAKVTISPFLRRIPTAVIFADAPTGVRLPPSVAPQSNPKYSIVGSIPNEAVTPVSYTHLTRIMRENGWLHERRRRPFGLTKATTEIQEQENLIKQNFHSNEPYQKLLTDISQVVCCDGKLYISPIMDCFNGEILSLLMRDNMRRELCIDTFKAAANRFPIAGATLHLSLIHIYINSTNNLL